MPNNRWILAAAWLWVGVSAAGLSQASQTVQRAGASYSIDVWGTDEGLPQNAVIAMIQSRDGYLWLGTLDGLVRFDGIQFTVFDESNTPGLNSSRIVHLFEDSRGNLWIGTEAAGVAVVRAGQVSPLGIGRGGREGRLVATCEDATGAVWLYTADGQLWRYEHGRTNVFVVGGGRPSYCRAMIAEESGPVWVGTDRWLYALDPTAARSPPDLPGEQRVPVLKLDFLLASSGGGYWRLADGRVQRWHTNRLERDYGTNHWNSWLAPVTAACEDRQGNLVVGTQGAGLFWYDCDGGVTQLSGANGLSHDTILSLVADREGSLWVGTDGGGLNRVKRQVFEVLEASRGLTMQSVSEDEPGGLWFGSNGGELSYWKEGAMQRFGPGQGLMNLYVRAVLVDRNRQVWVGTYGGGLYQFTNGLFRLAPGSEALNREISALHEDRGGRLWVGTQAGLARREGATWRVFTSRDGLSSDVVRAIADDPEGNLWVGTEGGGLNRLSNNGFTTFRETDDGLPGNNISALHVDEEGVLWIGTFGHGLARLHQGQWTRYTTQEGLVSNRIRYLIEDDEGYLWIGSNAGLMRTPKQAFARGQTNFIPCRVYRKADGLPTRECSLGSQPAACRTREGTLWFPTIKGLAAVDPARLAPNPHPPPVVIESVLIEGQAVTTAGVRASLPAAVVVPPGKERLEIHYTALNLSAPDRARFKYRMEGHETDWTDAGDIRLARYSKLPPGDYRFQVTACNEDGVWNEIGSGLAVIVQPPFWRTWWFLTTMAAGLLGGVVALVHYLSTQKLQRQVERLRQQEAVEKERSRIARDLHDQLGASLTQVSLLGELVETEKDAPHEVEGHARQISQTARDTTRVLDEIVWAVNPSNDTLDGLITYVCKYAQEYLAVAGLRYRLDVPAHLPGIAIPPDVRHNVFLATKEAVTNVVRHAGASEVRLRLRLDSGCFTLEIEDNGCGLRQTDGQAAQPRNGLRNMRKRMEDLGGSFSIGPGAEGGTVVRLTAPLG